MLWPTKGKETWSGRLDGRGYQSSIGYSKHIPRNRKRANKGDSNVGKSGKHFIVKMVSRAQRMRKTSRKKTSRKTKSNPQHTEKV